MEPIPQESKNKKRNRAQSPYVSIETNREQNIHFDQSTNEVENFEDLEASIEKAIILGTAQFIIIAALIMAGCGMLLRLFSSVGDNSTIEGLLCATILLTLGLMASCEKSNRAVGRLGYYLSLVAMVIFGLNFLRLGYKWFEPSMWWRIAPLLALSMGCSALFAFYKVCRARRDRSGLLIAIGSVAIASAAAVRWNDGQGLHAIDSSYTITVFCLLFTIVIFRFRDSIAALFRKGLEFAPVPIVGLLLVAGAIKITTTLQPQGAIANVIEALAAEGGRPLCALSGPTIGAELAKRLPATMVAAAVSDDVSHLVQDMFSVGWLRVYRHNDLIGVELAGATKNVIALAAGMIDGMEVGYNAKSALLARGLAEIARLGAAMGARVDTFFGVAGVGDLATTCFSPLGRNRSCGERIGRGENLDEILSSTVSVVEGVPTTRSVVELAKLHNVEMPITAAVNAILFDGLDPHEAITSLMKREPKAEWIG